MKNEFSKIHNRIFGLKVEINHKLVRSYSRNKGCYWELVHIPRIGIRTLSNGKMINGSDNEFPEFYYIPNEYISALLVVSDMYHKPFYILTSTIRYNEFNDGSIELIQE